MPAQCLLHASFIPYRSSPTTVQHPHYHHPGPDTFPSLRNQTLPALTPHLSVISGSLVFRGPQACQTSSGPSKKYPCPSLPLPYPHHSRPRQTKIKSQWIESCQGSCFADQSVDTWLSLTGWALNPIVSPTGLLSVVPLSLWQRAGERPD